MKKAMVLMISSMIGIAISCKANDGLVLFIEPSAMPFTSESVPVRVVFTNANDKTLVIPEPILGRNLALRVFDEHGKHLSQSGSSADHDDDDGVPIPVKERITLKPYEAWKTEIFDLFTHSFPSFLIEPNKNVRVVATYSLDDKNYEGNIALSIPAHNLEIKPEYISSEKGLAIAIQELEKGGIKMDTFKETETTIQCINGVYRVTLSRPILPGAMGNSSFIIKIDATSGEILQVSAP